MKKAAYNIMPGTEEILKTMGEQIKLARLRRDLSVELVSERAGISRSSLFMLLYCMPLGVWIPISFWSRRMTCLDGSFRI